MARTYVRNGRTQNRLTYQRNLTFRNARAHIRISAMTDDDLTRDEIHDHVTWLQSIAREGAKRVHARAAFAKPVQLTDAESAAQARARLDRRKP